ncbi:MAG: phage holin family protein [Bdellovibrionales bacterium]|nr:phage holin family protein [Bdellovibrionales bacterium]
MNGIIHLVISALALTCTAYFVPGFKVQSFGYALLAALVIGLVNFLIRPVLILLTLPINILTLGLFTFVINALCLKLAANLIPGFDIDGFGTAFIGAIILSIIGTIFNMLVMA